MICTTRGGVAERAKQAPGASRALQADTASLLQVLWAQILFCIHRDASVEERNGAKAEAFPLIS